MAEEVILVDTSVLIDYFRKTDKSKTRLGALALAGHPLCISLITEYEVSVGANADQLPFWSALLDRVVVLPLSSKGVYTDNQQRTILAVSWKRRTVVQAGPYRTSISFNGNPP